MEFSPIQLARMLSEVLCDAYARCRLDLRPRLVFYEDLCRGELEQRYLRQFNLVEPAIEAARLVYQADAFDTCLAAIDQSTCEDIDLQTFEAQCDQAFVGQLAIGSPCTLDAECSGGFCPGEDGCSQRCMPLSAQGQPCDIDGPVQCRVGLDCGFEKLCQPKIVAASLAGQNQLCTQSRCRAGLRCVPSPEPTCIPYEDLYILDADEQCPPFDAPLNAPRCRPPLVCQYTSQVAKEAGGRCVMRPTEGQKCALTFGDRTTHCEAGLFCAGLDPARGQYLGRCTRRPDVDEPCGSFYGFPAIFSASTRCRDTQCSPMSMPGEPCMQTSECAFGQCLNAVCQLQCDDTSPLISENDSSDPSSDSSPMMTR
ncbi:MAG: hypothetical protein VX589_03580 [Myxococcota bacterium]|nr:hypothetical protein [Myxococcota bacterium]